jgi:hypothetical protein
MEIVQRAVLQLNAKSEAFAIVLVFAIYFGALSSGTAPGDFATMTVFP